MSEAVSKERSRNYLQQIKGSIIYKAIGMAASFCAIPLMITYLGQEQFGVWSTLLTVMSWIGFFDLGIGNGLRNKIAESLAKGDSIEAARYIASGYSLIGLIALLLWVIVTAISLFVPWQTVFNSHAIGEEVLRTTIQISAFLILLNFWLGLINALLGAVQKTSLISLGQLISNVLALALVYILTKTNNTSISFLAIVYGLSQVISNLYLTYCVYDRYPELRPNRHFNKNHLAPLLAVGGQFFLIQIAVLVIFATDKILITQFFGPFYVAQYEILFKYFSVITFVHSLVINPLVSAYTDAYCRKDFIWIKQVIRKQLLLFVIVIISVVAAIGFAKPIIRLWVGGGVEISFPMVISMGLYVAVCSWNNIFGSILAGIGKIRLGAIYTVLIAVFNIPLAYYFSIKLGYGVFGIIMGNILSISASSIISPVQVCFFIYSKNKSPFLSGILR